MSECISCRSIKRSQITCEYCPFQACATCYEQFILTRTVPTCMDLECKREWTRQFMARNFTKIFMSKKYKCHRENIIADQQLALLPATQPEVVRIQDMQVVDNEINDINVKIHQLAELRTRKHQEWYRLKERREPINKERRVFVRHCPADNCKGYLSSKWKCGICNVWCCSQCHEIKGLDNNVDHTCDPVVVESIREIGSTSKNCPKCYVPIFKIEGCDQMWCTLCEVYFSWQTGEIDTSGRYHNPHALEALRRRNREGIAREPGDIICGREINHQMVSTVERRISRLFRHFKSEQELFIHRTLIDDMEGVLCDKKKMVSNFIQKTIHMREVVMRPYRVNIDQRNLNLRIEYMMNQITMDDFKTKLQIIHKKYSKSNEIYQVFDMVVVSLTDILYRFIEHINETAQYIDLSFSILAEIGPICDFANECFANIEIAYGGIVPYIKQTLKVVRRIDVIVRQNAGSISISGGGGRREQDVIAINP